MSQITELAWIPVKADAENSDAAQAMKNLGPQMLSQPGLEASYHGRPAEMPNSVDFVNGMAPNTVSNDLQIVVMLLTPLRSLGHRTSLQRLANVCCSCRG
jgi:hypothetical protein